MPRAYVDKYGRYPLFTNERGVGVGMANDRKDVMLIQFLLKGILHGGKTFLGTDTHFTPPTGAELNITGIWDEPSRRYLTRWEELRYEAKAYWGHGTSDPTQFPGTVVPYTKGGKKIKAMAEMCVVMFGSDSYAKLNLPNVTLPDEVAKDLFVDPF